MSRKHILCVVGTRPEAIKTAPVVWALRDAPGIACEVVLTSQHDELLEPLIPLLGLAPVEDLDLMRPGQAPAAVTASVISGMNEVLQRRRPDLVLAQGDTASVLGTALAAHYQDIPLAHVEAGLRTGNPRNPFPEEANRVLTSRLARLHLAPTSRARDNLLAEGVDPERIHIVGNTVIDALLWVRERIEPSPLLEGVDGPKVLATAHRRESFGAPLVEVLEALKRVPGQVPGARVFFPVHPNPGVREPAQRILGQAPGVMLLDPLPYPEFVALLAGCDLVLTDSGGIQEEAPALDRPVLVLREQTERPECVEVGAARLVGPHRERIVEATVRLLTDREEYTRMAAAPNPFGDGAAGRKIAEIAAGFLGGAP